MTRIFIRTKDESKIEVLSIWDKYLGGFSIDNFIKSLMQNSTVLEVMIEK